MRIWQDLHSRTLIGHSHVRAADRHIWQGLCYLWKHLVELMSSAWHLCAGVEALNLAKWPIGGGQEQAVMVSLGHHMCCLTQLDLADSLVSPPPPPQILYLSRSAAMPSLLQPVCATILHCEMRGHCEKYRNPCNTLFPNSKCALWKALAGLCCLLHQSALATSRQHH